MAHTDLKRVDQYFCAILQGLLSDGELTLNRIDPKALVDKAEELVREAIARADKVYREL